MTLPPWSKLLAVLIPWSLAVVLSGWIVALRFPPDGMVRLSSPFDGSSPWFTPFQPGERVTSPGAQPDGWNGQRITAEPVYASARLPGAYDTVTATFEIRSLHQPLAEMGLLRDEASFQFEIKPLFSEALSTGWHQASINGVQGMVRDGYPDASLLRTDFDRLMVWYATAAVEPRTTPSAAAATPPLGGGDVSQPVRAYDISLRGSHDFSVIPADGHVHFTFRLQDMNRSRDAKNRAAFRLTKGDEVISLDSVSVSGSSDTKPSMVFEQSVNADHLSPGVYRLSFLGDDDFFIRGISTDAKHWVMGPRLYIGDTVGYRDGTLASTLWTNSLHLSADTFHNEGLQRVSLGSSSVQIGRTHTPYPLDRAKNELVGDAQLKTEKGSVRFVGDGYFALDRDALFFPSPRRLTAEADPAGEGIVAILTPYVPAVVLNDGWYRVSASWTLPPTQEPLKFSLGLPGVVARNGAFDIRRATMTYQRPPLSPTEWWRAVKRELATAWKRL